MTLYTQALTYAINNIDNLCYYFETEIEKQLEKKTHLTDCTYFTLSLSLENSRFVPHVIKLSDTEYPSISNYNRIILTNPRSQGCPRFQSGEELANSVGKINA